MAVHKGLDWSQILSEHAADIEAKRLSQGEIARRYGVHKTTVQRAWQRWRGRVGEPTTQRSYRHPPIQHTASWPVSATGATIPSPPSAAKTPALDRLVAYCRRGPRSLADVCDELDVGPTRASQLVELAREQGVPLQLQGDRLAWHLPEECADDEATVDVSAPVGGWHQFAVASDVHFGSKYCRDDYLADFFSQAYERGCRLFLLAGDQLDGEYKHGLRELRAHGFDEQADELIEKLPRGDRAEWYLIDGNHDGTLTQASGAVCGRALVDRALRCGRTDLHFLGQRRGLLRLYSGHEYAPKVELWHPKKGAAYALSYHLQKKCESYAPGTKPDFLIAGHVHQFCYFTTRGIHALFAGTFQGQGSAYGHALGTPTALGGTIVSYTLTEGGTVRQVAVERFSYYEREDARTVAIGAA